MHIKYWVVMALIKIDEPEKSDKQNQGFSNHPVWRLGFRPFYLLATSFAAISIPLWLASYSGWFQAAPNVNLLWHMHEMVFGFAIAVIIGFLYTAGRNWTGLWTPRGGQLATLSALWLAGRLSMLATPTVLTALIDWVFIPLATWPIYQVLKRAGNKRNMFLVGLLSLLTLENTLFHAASFGWLEISPIVVMQGAILVIVIITSVIGGRVIPGFTANAIPGLKTIVEPKRDKITIALTVAASVAWLLPLPAAIIGSLAISAAIMQIIRLAGWQPQRTLQRPLLWILHISYGWMPLGFILLGLAEWEVLPSSAAFHALAVGTISGLIVGMITRTALGHTGRQLKAGRPELCMYMLIQIGALARLIAAITIGSTREFMLAIAALSWSATFLLYLTVYGPYLLRLRLDGKEG